MLLLTFEIHKLTTIVCICLLFYLYSSPSLKRGDTHIHTCALSSLSFNYIQAIRLLFSAEFTKPSTALPSHSLLLPPDSALNLFYTNCNLKSPRTSVFPQNKQVFLISHSWPAPMTRYWPPPFWTLLPPPPCFKVKYKQVSFPHCICGILLRFSFSTSNLPSVPPC